MVTSQFYLFIGLFVAFTVTFTLLLFRFSKKKLKIEERLEKFLPQNVIIKSKKKEEEKSLTAFRKLLMKFASSFKGNERLKKWEPQLNVADVPYSPEEFFALRLLVAGALPFLVFVLGYHWIFIILGAFIGYLVPSFYLKYKRKKRLSRCSEQLSETLGTMANALRAGFSFMQAMQLVSKEMPDPIGPEFAKTIRDMKYGINPEVALKRLVDRLPDKDLELVVNALIIQRTTGGNLAQLLETMQETMYGRFRVKEELRTLTAQGRMSSWIITLLPVALALYFNSMNPEYFGPLLEHPLGWLMITVAVVSGIMGWIVIRKIVQVEV